MVVTFVSQLSHLLHQFSYSGDRSVQPLACILSFSAMVRTGSLHHRKENTEGRKWGIKRKAHEEEEIIADKREKMNKYNVKSK